MWVIRKKAPRLPGVLIAVALATVVSWQTGFERNAAATLEQVAEPEARLLLEEFVRTEARILEINAQIAAKTVELKQLQEEWWRTGHDAATLNYEIELLPGCS
jgi:SulP family sulfate permease